MKTIKVIELLNKIANGEDVPQKVKYNNEIYYYKKHMTDYSKEENYYLFDRGFRYNTETFLNKEIEIIEEDKKIEKLPVKTPCILPNRTDTEISHIPDNLELTVKINEIIDYINNKEV